MHLTRHQQKRGMVLNLPTRADLLATVRKAPVRSGQAHKAATDYARKPKHKNQSWGDDD